MGSTSHVDATGAIVPGKAVQCMPAPVSAPASSPVKKAKHSHATPVAIVEDVKEEKEAKKQKKDKKSKDSKKDKSS